MLDQEIARIERELDDQVVDFVGARGVTRGELSAAFNKVCDASNWKLPIDATVAVATDHELAVLHRAVQFFAGCVPQIYFIDKATVRVRAVGYYVAVGA